MVTTPQIALLLTAALLVLAGVVASALRVKRESESLHGASRALYLAGAGVTVLTLAWHSFSRGSWRPLDDNFDALSWLGFLLLLFVLYVQRRNRLGGLDWFVMPIVALLMIGAVVFGRTQPHEYVASAWSLTHRIGAYGGAAALLIAAGVGMTYLLAQWRLRSKSVSVGTKLPSLERLEHLTLVSCTVGFALITVAAVLGSVKMLEGNTSLTLTSPKILLSLATWLVYAVVLHSPINPSFRGRKVAILSVVGFVLLVGAIVATQFVPPGLGSAPTSQPVHVDSSATTADFGLWIVDCGFEISDRRFEIADCALEQLVINPKSKIQNPKSLFQNAVTLRSFGRVPFMAPTVTQWCHEWHPTGGVS